MPKDAKTLIAEAKKQIEEISPDEAQKRIENGAIALDVREDHEFEEGHIPNAVHMPRGSLEYKITGHPATEDPSTPICAYCKGGGRGAMATARLQEMGYTNVASIQGGLSGWIDAGHPIQSVGTGEDEEE